MTAGYHVDPGALEAAAAAFEGQSEVVKAATERFDAAARLPDSAFGNLPDSYNLANQYETFFNQVLADLAKLQESLHGTEQGLRVTGANYRTAEASNTIPRRA